jgi:hypothetical protein
MIIGGVEEMEAKEKKGLSPYLLPEDYCPFDSLRRKDCNGEKRRLK